MKSSAANINPDLLRMDFNCRQNEAIGVFVANCLRNLIVSGRLPAHGILPPTSDLARLWDVGYVTAHRVLVRLTGEKLLRRTPRRGTEVADIAAVRAPFSRQIAVLVFRESRERDAPMMAYFQHLMEGIQDVLQKHDVIVMTFNLYGTSGGAAFLRHCESSCLDAVVVLRCHDHRLLDRLTQRRLPVILISPHKAIRNAFTILRNEERAADDAVNYLVANGHRRLGIVLRETDRLESKRRFRALTDAMQAHGLSVNPNWIKADCCRSGGPPDDFLDACLADPHRPTAIVLADVYVPMVKAAAQRAGLRIPGDLTLLRYAETRVDASCFPALELDSYEYGAAVGNIIVRSIYEGGPFPEHPCLLKVPYQLQTAPGGRGAPGSGPKRRENPR